MGHVTHGTRNGGERADLTSSGIQIIVALKSYQPAGSSSGSLGTPSCTATASIELCFELTCLSQEVYDNLKLSQHELIDHDFFGKTINVRTDRIGITFDTSEGLISQEVQVVRSPIAEQVVQCLIGRNVLEEGVFTYNGPEGRWTLSF